MSGKQAEGKAMIHPSFMEEAQIVTLSFFSDLFSWLEEEVGSSYYLSLGFWFLPHTVRAVAPCPGWV